MVENLPVSEYSPLDTVNVVRGLLDTFAALYPQLQDLDLRQSAPELKVPVYLVEGRFEPRGRKDPARDWFEHLKAPEKRWVEFETSGHRPLFEQPAEFARLMRTVAAVR
jgi:pimeloyl-ACP methyl ester carboxylesterase